MSQDRDDKDEALESLANGDARSFVADWLDAIESQSTKEKAWREVQAKEAWNAYKGDPSSVSTDFNIFHSNIETLVPALYNSTPIPDVRRRFNDEDLVAAEVSEILERSINFSIDDYDFNGVMKNVVKDMAVVDRGCARVRYEATYADVPEPEPDEMQPALPGMEQMGGNGGPPLQQVEYEEALCEYVPWRSLRLGPAVTWDGVPWVAFEHYLSRAEVKKILAKSQHPPELQAQIEKDMRYNYAADETGDESKEKAREVPKFGSRARVWEIWDKDTKTVIFIATDYKDQPLSVLPDPLELRKFFPMPKPAMIIEATDSMMPITSYSIYSNLIIELNEITSRITALVKQIRVRGGYAGIQAEIELIADADDGELVPLNNAEIFATAGGGLEKAIVWWPIEPVILAVKELVQQRELVKQTIYEVTGLSDILRGATDASETATAQEIKQKWGSIRVQAHQKEIERFAADLFRLKAEVYCKWFDIQTLLQVTGLKYPTAQEKQRAQATKQQGEQMFAAFQQEQQQYQQIAQQAQEAGEQPPPPPQPPIPEDEFKAMAKKVEEVLAKPTVEELQELMRDAKVMKYRVDVESDSTVRADLTRNQEQMKGFLDGTAAYAGAIGPLVQQKAMPGEIAVEIFAAFTRHFRLGKQAEDAIEKWAEQIRKGGIPQQSDPVADADAKLKSAQAEKTMAEKTKVETEAKLLPEQHKLAVGSKRAELAMGAREKSHAARGADFDRQEGAKERRAKHGLEKGKMQQADRHHEGQLNEAKASRQGGEKLKRMEMGEGRKARREGYAMQAAEKGVAAPQFDDGTEQQGQEQEYRTDEEMQQQGAQAEQMQGLNQAVAQLAEGQAQQAQALQKAIEVMTQALTAPKEVIRDKSGKAIGSRVVIN